MKNEKRSLIVATFFAVFLFVITYQVIMGAVRNPYSDYLGHAENAELLLQSGLGPVLKEIGYPFWAFLVAGIMKLSGAPAYEASAIAGGLLNAFTYVLVFSYLAKECKEERLGIAALTWFLLLVGPFYIPWYNPDVYNDQVTPNIWHNPTTICVRPFAFLAFLLILRVLKEYEEEQKKLSAKTWLLLAACLVLCNLAKPSFVQIAVPGLAVYLLILLIRTRGKAFGFCFQTASAFVPCVCVMLWQMIVSFGTSSSAEGGIEIAWFDVMGASSPSIPFSMLLGYLFPLYIILTNLRIMKERDMQVTFFMWFAGFLEAAALAETGYRRYHGNFGWGYVLATFLVYVMTFRYFLKRNREYDYQNLKDRILVLGGWVIFALQLFIGIYYISTFFIPVG